jgi:DNA (cytosine-5)-methyltransferase 1
MDYLVKNVGTHRGAPRLYFQSRMLERAGLTRGTRFKVEAKDALITLRADPQGTRIVSGKDINGRSVPVIDLNSAADLLAIEGMSAVKVEFGDGEIRIAPLASEASVRERWDRLKSRVNEGLRVTGLAFGGGILDHAVHEGFDQVGLPLRTAAVNEIDEELVEHACGANPVISSGTALIAAPMQELVQDAAAMARLERSEVVVAGIPCSGASRAGKSKHAISMMEAHPEVGHLVVSFLMLIQRLQPAVIVLENVPEYADSASAQLIRQHLRDMGYTTHETELNAKDFGSLEARNRWFLVGATRGLQIDLSGLADDEPYIRTVGDILDPDSLDKRWGTFDYLKDKAVRDKEAGKGFQMQVVTAHDTQVPTLRKGYHKGGSTDPLLQHPTDPNLLRLFSGDEHARIKGVDPALVAGLSNTTKHIILGQGVVPGPVVALARRIAECIKRSLAGTSDGVATTAGYSLARAVG